MRKRRQGSQLIQHWSRWITHYRARSSLDLSEVGDNDKRSKSQTNTRPLLFTSWTTSKASWRHSSTLLSTLLTSFNIVWMISHPEITSVENHHLSPSKPAFTILKFQRNTYTYPLFTSQLATTTHITCAALFFCWGSLSTISTTEESVGDIRSRAAW